MKSKIQNPVFIIAVLGLCVRIFFLLIGAKYYFGRENIFVDLDTQAWQECITTFIDTGTYSTNRISEYGYFIRMPGYSFFIGIFYLLSGQNWDIAFPLIGWFQTILDFFIILLIYRVGLNIFNKKNMSLILSALYAFYPFIIVWTPVVYSEHTSIVLLLLSINYFFHPAKNKFWLSGVLIGIAVLFRPQLILLMPIMILALLLFYKVRSEFFRKAFIFSFMFLLAYSPWPLRNYINYNKIILTQDLRGAKNWNVDVISFMQYIYSVKSGWEPQFSEIIGNKKTKWPAESYLSEEDSAKLHRVAYLSQNCGSGFGNWMGYWKEPVAADSNCNAEIKKIFDELREEQMKKNPVNFWIKVPMQNLKKGIFKLTLTDTSTFVKKAASILFIYRTFLLLCGMLGLWLMYRQKGIIRIAAIIIGLYFISLYVLLCSGTAPQFRNIEMRYFLPADILMLIPAAFVFNNFYERFFQKNNISE